MCARSQVVLATGAIERPMVFPNNDVPGVMLASAARNYAVQYAVRPGQRAVIVTSGDSAYEAAEALHERGVIVVAIVDTRREVGDVARSANAAGIPVLAGYAPAHVRGSRGVRGIEVKPLAPAGKTLAFRSDAALLV